MVAVFSWILSVLGIVITYTFLLGAAMSTVPQKLNLPTAMGLAVLPAIVIIGASWTFWKGSQPMGKNVLLLGVPFLLAIITLIMIGGSVKLPRVGGPYTEYFGKDTDEPHYRLEIRPASVDLKDGYAAMQASQGDNATCYVSDEILFTQADLISTSTYRETRNGPTTITLDFHGGAQPRLQELSRNMQGGYWAILLDDELWLACRIVEPLERGLTLSPMFDARSAERYARGIVQEL